MVAGEAVRADEKGHRQLVKARYSSDLGCPLRSAGFGAPVEVDREVITFNGQPCRRRRSQPRSSSEQYGGR